MSSDSKNKSDHQEEINILDLFVLIGKFFEKIFRGLVDIIRLLLLAILSKWYYFVIALALTVISAIILNSVLDSYYQSDLTIRVNNENNQVIQSSLNKVGDYANENNNTALSKELNLSPEDASSIKEIEVLWYYDIGKDGNFDGVSSDVSILLDTNIVKVDSLLIIRTKILDPLIISELTAGLIEYFNNNSFLRAVNQQRIAALEATLIQTNYEIEKLDSLQKKEYYIDENEMRLKEGQLVISTEKTIRLYHNDIFRLIELKQNIERDLSIYGSIVTIIEDFSVPIEQENGIKYYALKLLWFFLGVALLFSLLVTFRKKIWIVLK